MFSSGINCFLSHFYIKPQPLTLISHAGIYCFLSHFYIKPQLLRPLTIHRLDCFLSHFYIKPQLVEEIAHGQGIASYLISTSNHNAYSDVSDDIELLLISFLHQTTTAYGSTHKIRNCFLSHFYIKPQPSFTAAVNPCNCFLSHFYIKPQRVSQCATPSTIASYLISTSNHNKQKKRITSDMIASYLISTSNHNVLLALLSGSIIASYLISTSNHNTRPRRKERVPLLLISFLHQTTTDELVKGQMGLLLLISFLHQTTT